MQIASNLGGFSLAQADILRKAMGKKKPEEMARQREAFVRGAVERGITQSKGNRIFDLMAHFAGYGFNKSHSAAYALISYATAYLKAHYPVEFMAASLTSEMDSTDRIVTLVEECRRMAIEVLPPDVNTSRADFTIEEGKIRFALGAVKNVGQGAIGELLAAREADGPFTSLHDLCQRVDLGKMNRRVLESLVGAGACEALGVSRAQLMAGVNAAFSVGQRAQRERVLGQSSLFGGAAAAEIEPALLPEVEPWDAKTRLAREKEFLGFYLSDHPLRSLRDEIAVLATTDARGIQDLADGADVRLVGMVNALKRTMDRKGKAMAFATIEDFSGQAEAIIFSDACEAAGADLAVESVVMIMGRVSTRENEGAKLVAASVMSFERARRELAGALEIDLEAAAAAELAEAIDSTLARHPGTGQIIFKIRGETGDSVRVLSKRRQVALTSDLIREVGELVGGDRVRLRREIAVPAGR